MKFGKTNRRPRAFRISREEYLSRAHEFAHNQPKKLTDDKVRQIRAIVGMTHKQIAAKFGVNHYTIWCVRNYQTWKHVR